MTKLSFNYFTFNLILHISGDSAIPDHVQPTQQAGGSEQQPLPLHSIWQRDDWQVRGWGPPSPTAGKTHFSAEDQHTWVIWPDKTPVDASTLQLPTHSWGSSTHVTSHVTCGFPFVILCLELSVRQGQQRGAQPSPLTSIPWEPGEPDNNQNQ